MSCSCPETNWMDGKGHDMGCPLYRDNPKRTQCGHNDQYGICPLERGHSGEHAKVTHRTYSAAELYQAEALGVQRGLEMAARHVEFNTVEFTTRWERITLAEEIRALQPVPQAPQADTYNEGKKHWNHRLIDGVPHICRGEHERSQGCVWEAQQQNDQPVRQATTAQPSSSEE